MADAVSYRGPGSFERGRERAITSPGFEMMRIDGPAVWGALTEANVAPAPHGSSIL